MKQIVNSNIDPNWPNLEIEHDYPIELFIDSLEGFQAAKKSVKILWIKEAEEISRFKATAIANYHNFNFLLTYDEEILAKCNNAHFMPFGTAWVNNYDFSIKKIFQVSHLTGFKEITAGHLLRKKIHYKQENITSPKDFYISQYGGVENAFNNKTLLESKNPLFDSQFHICIENSNQKNFFTEKLIDCLITKTIPIFYGCDNIGDFFDINGFFVVNNFKDIINTCNSLTEEVYESKKTFIEENYTLALQYVHLTERLKNILHKILNEKKLSIIIPAYEAHGRGPEFLGDLLDSIKKQTYKNIEVIVPDHSINDEIKKIVDHWKKFINVIHFFNEEGRGNSSINMNAGIKKASGGFIKIMHLDDKFCNDQAIEKMMEQIAPSNYKWGGFGFNHNYESENCIRREMIPSIEIMGCPSVSFFINDETNYFDEELIIINDFDMHQRLYKKYGEPLIINDICVTIRMHEGQVTHTAPTDREKQEKEYYETKTQTI